MKPIITWEFKDWSKREFFESNELPKDELCISACWVFFYNNKVLLTQNQRWIEIPWWHRENWETIEQTLIREMWEEIWIDLNIDWVFKLRWYRKVMTIKPIPDRQWWFYPQPYYMVHYIWKVSLPPQKPWWEEIISNIVLSKEEINNCSLKTRELLLIAFEKIAEF